MGRVASRKKALVLIVDDFDDTRALYTDYFETCGFEVLGAGNGREALERCFAHRPDLVVMDLALPIVDGWEATRALKDDPRSREIPIVVLTGYASAGAKARARAAGCDAFLLKPSTPAEVMRTVRRLIDDPSRPGTSEGAADTERLAKR